MGITAVRLGDVMKAPVLTLEREQSLWDAWQMLVVSGLRHIAVIDADGQFLGILSDRMILGTGPVTPESLGSRTTGDLLGACATVCLAADDSPEQAARLMAERSMDAVAVLDARGRLLGIVTESDLVRWLLVA